MRMKELETKNLNITWRVSAEQRSGFNRSGFRVLAPIPPFSAGPSCRSTCRQLRGPKADRKIPISALLRDFRQHRSLSANERKDCFNTSPLRAFSPQKEAFYNFHRGRCRMLYTQIETNLTFATSRNEKIYRVLDSFQLGAKAFFWTDYTAYQRQNLTFKSLVCEMSHLLMNCWGSLAKLRKNSRFVFRELTVSTVSWILLSRLWRNKQTNIRGYSSFKSSVSSTRTWISCWLAVVNRKLFIWIFRVSSTSTSIS